MAKEYHLFKTGLSSSLYDEFLGSYQSISAQTNSNPSFFVYADEYGIKYLASVADDDGSDDGGLFATSVAGDGWIELLSM